MKTRLARKCASDKGAELIEFALVFPMLLLVVLGIIDWGLVFSRYEVLFNAAREGARVRVLPGYACADVETRVNQYIQGMGLTAENVTTACDDDAPQIINIGAGCISVHPVTVSYVHTFSYLGGIMSYFGTSFGTKTLTATASMRNEAAAVACPPPPP